MRNGKTLGAVRERERERAYLTNKIGFFCRAKRIGFYKKTEFKKLFFEGLFFFVFLKKQKCENLIYFKDKYM